MEKHTNQWVDESKLEQKQMKKFKTVAMPAIFISVLLLIALVTGCNGRSSSNVKDAASSSNDAVETGIEDGADAVETGVEDGVDAINDGVNDGTDAISDVADDIEDEFQTEANLVSVAVTPTTSSVIIGATKVFIARATYLNGSTRKVTSSSTWSSGTTSVATTSGTSTVTGIAVGTSVITANYLGKTGTATLTVTSN